MTMNKIAAFVIFIVAATATVASGQNVSTPVATSVNSTLDAGLDVPVANDTKAVPMDVLKPQQQPEANTTETPAGTKAPPSPASEPTTTLAPKVGASAPGVNSYYLPSSTADKYCILVTSALQFTVEYPSENNTKISKATFNAGDNSTVIPELSTCGNESVSGVANLAIQYPGFQVHYMFGNAHADPSKYGLAVLSLAFRYGDSELFPGSDTNDTKFHLLHAMTNGSYDVPNDHSYRCDVDKSWTLVSIDGSVNASATISSFKFAAFGQYAKDDYGDAEECSDDFTTSDIVPIAVGCALAALVVIVLIAYLIGRRRSRQKGYQSV